MNLPQIRTGLIAAVLLTSSAFVYFASLPERPKGPGEGPGYHEQWFERHKNDAGIIPSGMQAQWLAHDRLLASRFSKAGNVIDTVESFGPFNQGGRTRAILVSCADSNLIFAGSISGGLWRSANGGANWTQLNDGASSLAVSCITQSPFEPDLIYYGTGESRANSSGVPGDGIFRSTDHGLTFNQVTSTAGNDYLNQVWSIAHSLADSSTIYAGTNSGGLYRSIDKGDTWSQVTGTAGAVTDILPFPDGHILFSRTSSGIYFSTTGLPGSFTRITSPAFPTSFQRIEIANCASFPDVVYAVFERVDSYNQKHAIAFCKSSDGGNTWAALTPPTIDYVFNNYCLLLGVSPLDSNKIVSGGSELVASTNGGVSWSKSPTVHADHHACVSLHAQSNTFLIGTDGGLCRKNWDSLSKPVVPLNAGYVSTQYYGGDYSPEGTFSTGGLQDNGSWLVSRTSSGKIRGADGGYSYISKQNSSQAYVSQQNGATYRTFDLFGVAGFTSITPPTNEPKDFVNFYVMNPADGNQLYYRTSVGIWRSLNAGSTWNKMNSTTLSGIQNIACSEDEDPTVYAMGSGKFYRFDHAAQDMISALVDLSSSLPNADAVGTITVDPSDPGTLYVGFTNYVSRPRAWKVLSANTDTPQWVNISSDLPAVLPVNQVQTDPCYPGKNLLAGTDFGLYYSTDSGASWQKDTRIPNVVVSEIKVRKEDSKAFVFTHGRGVWYLALKRPIPNTGFAEEGVLPQLNLFPNPATTRFEIEPYHEPLMYRLFDGNGRLVSEYRCPAFRKGEFDMQEKPEGTYYLVASGGHARRVYKVVKAVEGSR
jgi:photosystem II stability/assembly factor-like uncharacterized protein